jgi:transglutaminase-like putative cysteine protease
VLNIYTGQSWTTNALVEPLAANLPPTPISGTILQRVERARPDAELLLGLPNLIAAGTDAEAEYLADGTLAALRAPVASYEVLSSPPARVSAPDSAPPPLESYLRLPEELPPRVRDLAVAVAGEGPPQAQALALESYLRELPYTYEVRPLPGGDDAVDQFLFQMRHGYCTYYASAMAVLARSLGIPARIATGYAGGSFDAATNTYTLYERDAHAWPELYVDGRWVAYEPTPIRELPQRASNTQAAPPPDMALPEATPPRPLARAWPLALGLGALAVVGAGLWLWRRRRLPLLLRAQQHLEAYGLRRGVAWPPGATLQEYGALLSAEGGAAASSVGAVIGLLSRARYRRQQLSDDEQRQLREASERLVAASRRARRMERQR